MHHQHRSEPAAASQPVRHVSQKELAHRWGLSPRTLERWRWLKRGPVFLRLGGRIVYRLQDIESYEAAQLASPATEPVSG